MKKIAIGLSLAVTAILAFLWLQKSQFEQKIKDLLAQQPLQYEKLDVSLFPQPRVELHKLHYQFGQKEQDDFTQNPCKDFSPFGPPQNAWRSKRSTAFCKKVF